MIIPNNTRWKLSRPTIYAEEKTEVITPYREEQAVQYFSYEGRYEHPAGHIRIYGCSYKDGYCHADFIFKGFMYHMSISEYRTPRSFCRMVKKWVEEITKIKP